MSLDPHHVHNFWGVSPALDLRDVVRRCRADQATSEEGAPPDASDAPFSTLLVGTNDPRHIVTTLARARRHVGPALGERSLSFHVYESSMVEAARHVLLLCVLMSDDLPPSERVERFLEIFMNATLRESTAELVETCAARLERVVGAMFAGEADAPDIASDRVCQVFDFSLLKFKEKDELVECFRSWRASPDPERGGVSAASAASRAARGARFDADALRDARLRRYYDDRYDHRRNVVDWDYNMRVDAAGAGVIHFKHFAQFRLTGIAYPVREATFPRPNPSLLSAARGTTKEFKDRDLKDRGRSVETRGFWGDILNSPYHCFGTDAEDKSLFRVANKTHVHDAVEVSEHNVAACLFEMRAGAPWRRDGGAPGGVATEAMNAWSGELDDEVAHRGTRADTPETRAEWCGGDGAVFEETWRAARVALVGPADLEKAFLAKPKFAGAFDAAVVGAWHAQKITPALGKTLKSSRTADAGGDFGATGGDSGDAGDRKKKGVLIVEGSKYFVFADAKASAAFAEKTRALARDAGCAPVPPAEDEPEDDEDVPESGIRADGSRRPRRARGGGVVKGVDDAHRCYVKTS